MKAVILAVAALCGAVTSVAISSVAATELFVGRLPSLSLLDHRGRPVDIARELSAPEEVAVLGFSFTGCVSICPPAELEMQLLDARLPAGARLVTLTLDPLTDTVERLAARAKERSASERWRFVTGDYAKVYRMLDRLDITFGTLNDHPPVLFVAVRGRIYRMRGQPNADDVLALIERLRR